VFRLSGVCFLLSFLFAFPAFLRLRQLQPDRPRPYRMPGGMIGAWISAGLCSLFLGVTSLLFFMPTQAAGQGLRETSLLAAETIVTIVVGVALRPRARGPRSF